MPYCNQSSWDTELVQLIPKQRSWGFWAEISDGILIRDWEMEIWWNKFVIKLCISFLNQAEISNTSFCLERFILLLIIDWVRATQIALCMMRTWGWVYLNVPTYYQCAPCFQLFCEHVCFASQVVYDIS